MHPFVIGELALGHLRRRAAILAALQDLPQATVAHDDEVMRLIDQHSLFGLGIGYVDVHLLAAVRLIPSVRKIDSRPVRTVCPNRHGRA